MMRKMEEADIQRVLAYLEKDIPNCLYLYLDVVSYGVSNENMTVWFDEKDGNINLVIMKYFDSFQIYSEKEDCDFDVIKKWIRDYGVERISTKKSIVEKILPDFEDSYFPEYGNIMEMTKYRKMKGMERVERATEEDIPEIVDMLLTDEENGSAYTKEEFEKQFIDRLRTGMGRNYVIRDDGKIVTHLAIVAETDKFMVAGYTMVNKEYRDTIYGTLIDSYLINEVGSEGKRIFAFMIEPRRIRMFQLMKNEIVAEYGKLIKRK